MDLLFLFYCVSNIALVQKLKIESHLQRNDAFFKSAALIPASRSHRTCSDGQRKVPSADALNPQTLFFGPLQAGGALALGWRRKKKAAP
jgi:hypothetical protein